MQHEVLRPLLLQPLHGQPREELPPALEVGLQRGDQQALPEPPRAAQEVVPPLLHQLVNQRRLIHVDGPIRPQILKACLPDRVRYHLIHAFALPAPSAG